MKNKTISLGIIIGLLILIAGTYFLLSKPLSDKKTLPSEAECEKIVLDTTLEFAHAVQAKDLSLFRNQTTKEFKQQFSHEQFNQAFGGYIEQNINLLPVAKLTPSFSPSPYMTKDGTLMLKGYFPSRPSEVHFNYNYIWRNDKWMIVGITLKVIPTE